MKDLAGSIWKQNNGQVTAEGCLKTPEDLDRYQRVIAETRPDSILECGTFSGKSALWFARQTGHPRVLTVDIGPLVDDDTREAAIRNGVRFYTGSSVDPACVDHVRRWARSAGRLMVVLDSDHSARHVRAEMEAYGPLVTPGCYMVVEDGIIRWIPYEHAYYGNSGPLDAIEGWMAAHGDEWEADMRIEDLHPTTQFPGGWLRRLEAPPVG